MAFHCPLKYRQLKGYFFGVNDNLVEAVLNYIKKEVVLCISLLLALVSMAFVPIDNKYISYIDFHTLTVLLSLMIIMAGLRSLGIFSLNRSVYFQHLISFKYYDTTAGKRNGTYLGVFTLLNLIFLAVLLLLYFLIRWFSAAH